MISADGEQHFEDSLARMRALELPSAVRARMRERLSAYADFHPVAGSTVHQARTSAGIARFIKMHVKAAAALVLLLTLGGGTSYAAESALPGETLYPVKVRFNEPIAGFFTIGDKANAKWQARLAERRLGEAEYLVLKGALDTETQAALGAEVAAHVKQIVSRAAKLDERGERDAAAGVRADAETSLRAHADVIAALPFLLADTESDADSDDDRANKTEKQAQESAIVLSLRNERESVAKVRKEASRTAGSKKGETRLTLQAAQEQIETADALLAAVPDAPKALARRAGERLDYARAALYAGREAFAEEAYEDASEAADDALAAAKEALALIKNMQIELESMRVFGASARHAGKKVSADTKNKSGEEDEDRNEHEDTESKKND